MTPPPSPPRRYSPLGQLVSARLREFYREPQAVFWVYGFPVLIVVVLGIAFRNQPADKVAVDVEQGSAADEVVQALPAEKFKTEIHDAETCRARFRTGRTDVVVKRDDKLAARPDSSTPQPAYRFLFDPARPGSVLAKNAVNDALQKAAGRVDPAGVQEEIFQEPGSRYVDFLVPGLLGMSLMGGGLWGVGFAIVDMRIRKLLKRFLATPMKKRQFLASIIISRLCFMVPEVLVLLVFSWLAFGVEVRGGITAVAALVLLGSFTFAGIGLLVASRANTLESISGLMNLIMLPMWVFSGIFFSTARFPQEAQPVIQALPLTALIDALRAVMLEGQSLSQQLPQLGILGAWGVGTFGLALRWFRWT